MAEQLLDGAQIGAGAKQMRGEGVAQRMRRRRLGQAERGARARNLELDDAGAELLPASADEQRIVRASRIGQSVR